MSPHRPLTDGTRLIDGRRSELRARLRDIEDRLVGIRAARGEWTDEEHDPEGFALVDEWSRLEGARSECERELVELDRADARVSAGSFGECEACGLRIPDGQLARRPARTKCVACTDGPRDLDVTARRRHGLGAYYRSDGHPTR